MSESKDRTGLDGGPLHEARSAPSTWSTSRRHPTRGDPSWRTTRRVRHRVNDIDANHLHIDTGYILRDLNVALPLERLHALAAEGARGLPWPTSHYSIMGYQGGDSSGLEQESAPEIAAAMKSEEVDLALLAPV